MRALISLEIIISAKSRDLNTACKKTCTKVSVHVLFEGSFDIIRVFEASYVSYRTGKQMHCTNRRSACCI